MFPSRDQRTPTFDERSASRESDSSERNKARQRVEASGWNPAGFIGCSRAFPVHAIRVHRRGPTRMGMPVFACHGVGQTDLTTIWRLARKRLTPTLSLGDSMPKARLRADSVPLPSATLARTPHDGFTCCATNHALDVPAHAAGGRFRHPGNRWSSCT